MTCAICKYYDICIERNLGDICTAPKEIYLGKK